MKLERNNIKKIILKHTKLNNSNKSLVDYLDSLQFLKLILFLEKKLKIKFSEKDFASKKIQDIDGLINIIKKK